VLYRSRRCARRGPNHRRPTAIKQWKSETNKKYQHTVEPLACVREDGKTVVTNRVAGNFPGSPVNLEFVFGLEGNKIASLEIRA
jgi:hypothetical protein